MRRNLALLTRTRVVALALALLVAGCSSRQHANPLDPANAETSGHPAGFTAIALSNQVILTWSSTRGLATQLFRSSAADPANFVAITPEMAPGRTSFVDIAALNGETYHYRLYFVTAKGVSGPPATADATPSRVVAWTTEGGQLLRLGADGRAVASAQAGVGRATYLTMDHANNLVWTLSSLDQKVVVVNASGIPVSIFGFTDPQVVAVDPLDGSGWITDYHGSKLWHYLPSGQVGTPGSIPLPGSAPLGIDVDSPRGVLWVCDQATGGRVTRLSRNGAILGQTILSGSSATILPSRVAVDSTNGDAWVTSFTGAKLFHLAPDGTVLHNLSVSGPLGVAIDSEHGRIWVTDVVASAAIAFRRDGSEEFRVTGLPGARDVAVEALTGEAWVTTSTTVARISPAGVLLTTTRGLSSPVGIGLDFVAP